MYRLGLCILPENKFYNLTIITMAKPKRWIYFNCDVCGKESYLSYKQYYKQKQHCCSQECRSKTTHGMEWTPELICWRAMKERCENKNNKDYKNYWWRWIKILYKDFNEFYKDIWPRPWLKYTVDRIDNNKWYWPWNCRWATKKEQSNNRRTNTKCIINWEEHNLKERAWKLGISYQTLKYYIKKWKINWSLHYNSK